MATTVSYERRQRHEFSAMIPETALRQGANDVRVFRVDPVRHPCRRADGESASLDRRDQRVALHPCLPDD